MKLSQQILQKTIMSQNMRQSLEILSLCNEDLAERIQEESLENPLLEIDSGRSFQVYDALATLKTPKNSYLPEGAEFFAEDYVTEPESLKGFLLKQKDQSFYSKEIKKLIELLISYLDEKGYLRISPEELVARHKLPLLKVEEALKALKGFEPWGVGAGNLEECLLIQMRQRKIREPLLARLIAHHLELLRDKKYPYIARELGTNLKEVRRLSKILKTLQPNPAFNFASEPTVFVRPDLYIYRQGDFLQVLFNKDRLPSLSLSSFYLDRLQKKKFLKPEERKYLQNKKKAADFLIQSVYHREERIKAVATFIIKHQKEFFFKGFRFLKPLKMIDLAKELQVHNSTVSRAVSGKYVSSPHGMMALRDFFIQPSRSSFLDSPSVEKIKSSIKTWVKEEDSLNPLSDEELKEKVEKTFKAHLTRRRIAQYRLELNIPKSRLRKLSFLYASQA